MVEVPHRLALAGSVLRSLVAELEGIGQEVVTTEAVLAWATKPDGQLWWWAQRL